MDLQTQQPRSIVTGVLTWAIAELRGTTAYCETCERSFGNVTSLAQHLATSPVHKRGDFKCDSCLQRFFTEDDREQHWDNSPKCDPGFQCDFCLRSFRTEEALEQHEQSTSSHAHFSGQDVTSLFKCYVCNRMFGSQAALYQHVQNSPAHNSGPENNKYDHENYFEDEDDQYLGPDDDDDYEYDTAYCGVCDRYFGSQKALTQHMQDSQAHLGIFYCNLCYRHFGDQRALTQHMLDSPAHLEIFYCHLCDRYFGDGEALAQHNQDSPNHSEAAYCDLCNQCFGNEVSLAQHMLDSPAHREAMFCNLCNRYFVNQEALAQHTRDSPAHRPSNQPANQRAITTETKPIATSTVIAQSTSNPLPQRVLDLASIPSSVQTIKPNTVEQYNCETCNRSFATQEALNQHTANAPAHRPHDCEVCHRAFESKSALEQHIRDSPAHTMTFDCDSCRRTFPSREALTSHVQFSQAHRNPTGMNTTHMGKYRVVKS